MGLELGRDLVQRVFHLRAIVDASAPDAQAFEKSGPELVCAKQSVQVGAEGVLQSM